MGRDFSTRIQPLPISANERSVQRLRSSFSFLFSFFLPFFFPSHPRLYASFRMPEGHARSLINVPSCWTIFCDPLGSRRWIFRASLTRDNERNNRSWNMMYNTCFKYPDILIICVIIIIIIIISVWIVSKCINWGWINDKRYLLSP